MAIINQQNVVTGGTTITYSAATLAGDSFQNGGAQRVRFRNTSGGVLRVAVDAPGTDNFGVTGDDHDLEYSVPAGGDFEAGPFRTDRYNDVNGRVQLTYPDGVTGLTLAVTN